MSIVFLLLPWYDVSMRNVMKKAGSICNMVAGGKSVLDACKRERINRATFYRWMNACPAVAEMYHDACKARLEAVENELVGVRKEIAAIRATVPAVRPKDGVCCGEFLRKIRNPYTTAAMLQGVTLKVSRRGYRLQRQRMRGRLVVPLIRLDMLRLERARLRGRVKRSVEKCSTK